MAKILERSPQKQVNSESCHHYWLIETPSGPTCRGICKLCGKERDFASTFEYLISKDAEKKSVKKDVSVESEAFVEH